MSIVRVRAAAAADRVRPRTAIVGGVVHEPRESLDTAVSGRVQKGRRAPDHRPGQGRVMLEGRNNASGWLIVSLAVVALVAFTGLLYVRGGSGSPIALSGATPTSRPSAAPSGSGRPGPSGSAVAASSAKPGTTRAPGSASASGSAAPTSVVAGATSRPTAAASSSPRATRSPSPTRTATASPSPTDAPAGFSLPKSPQAVSVALENGQGGCPEFPTGGILVETSFTQSGADRLSAKSPSGQRLSGRISPDGTFTLAGANPVERWIGTLTRTGGTGSYFVVSNGCTEGYDTTIAFH